MDGWRVWFFRDGRLRAFWRALLFLASFVAIVQAELLLLPWLAALPMADDRISAGLIAQSFMILTAAVLAGWALLHWVEDRPLGDLGFPLHRGVPGELGAGLGIGVVALGGTVLLLTAVGGFRYVDDTGSVAGWVAVSVGSLAAFTIPAFAEEALFRGYLFQVIRDGAGTVVAVLVTTLLFTWAHGANPNVSATGLLNIFLAGVLLAIAVVRTGSLWLAGALHVGWNWSMAGPLDLPVSGLGAYDMPLYDGVPTGPVWLTGGAFGPEGGLAGTLAVLAALGLTLWTTRPGSPLAPGRRDRRG